MDRINLLLFYRTKRI